MQVFQRRDSAFLLRGGGETTITEASEQYNIPISISREYETWGLCDTVKTVMGAWQYDVEDIERLSMIMTLHDIGFQHDEIANDMRLLLRGDSAQAERMRILKQRLNRLDCLRHQMRSVSARSKT